MKGLLQVLDNKLFIMQKSDKWEKFSKEVDIIACFDKRIRCYYIKTRKISQILWNENVKIFFEVRIFIIIKMNYHLSAFSIPIVFDIA